MPPKIPVNTSKNAQAKSRHRHATKKQLSPEERSRRLYKSLIAQIDGGYFKNALKTCDKSMQNTHYHPALSLTSGSYSSTRGCNR